MTDTDDEDDDDDDEITQALAKAGPDDTDAGGDGVGTGTEKLAKPSRDMKPSFATYAWVASGFGVLGIIGWLWWYGPETVAMHKASRAPVIVPVPGREALSATRAEQTRQRERSAAMLDEQSRIAANASAADMSGDMADGMASDGTSDGTMDGMASANTGIADSAPSSSSGTTVPSGTDEARIAMQRNEAPQDLADAPAGGMIEATSEGRLPTKGPNGKLPWMVYARPFDTADPRPRVAVLIAHLGRSKRMVDLALQALPPGISLSFMAYSNNLGGMMQSARTKGHEVLLSVPLEPAGFPRVDSGPNSLLTSLRNTQNRDRLRLHLGSAVGYIGVVPYRGVPFLEEVQKTTSFLRELERRGLMYVDTGLTENVTAPSIANTLQMASVRTAGWIDTVPTIAAVTEALAALEAAAQEGGAALGIANGSPAVFEALRRWAPRLRGRGLALAPVSALATTGDDMS